MNCKIGIIAASLLVCSLAGPARAELSESAATGEEASAHSLSAPEKGAAHAGVNSLLDRFSGIGVSDPSSDDSYNPSIPIVLPISETTLYTSFTRADSAMNAYYSRSGTDNEQAMASFSRSADVVTAVGGDLFTSGGAGLAAAAVQGYFVGSGSVVGSATIAPMQGASSSPSIIQSSPTTTAPADVPIPLPFFLTGSGLAALLALRKRAGMKISHTEQTC